jgi:hypothetical protein
MLMSEGYTIYCGPPSEIPGHFSKFGLSMGKYTNPADMLIRIATIPRKTLKHDITIIKLA